ncbi:TetR/AcrR family transcriptional regulator [Streptomyces sp. NBRC 109706]|uniref:TetR/AcrR family transcriptional regulator n=1 Tax=Streptomyces sp. NBRC 109706 TaxID=1550035 RepID=UPI0007828A20|nr:TetR/AcrR family transcriptional regulator [Streptomyces sp. NBRC 109706]
MARSEAARTALLDAAERLFARAGIAKVSDRKVAEVAGNTNHSAVSYYFGGRRGLLRALLTRHLSGLEEDRQTMFERADSLLGDVRSLVVPVTNALAELPQPSVRARFVNQALHDPVGVALLHQSADIAPASTRIMRSVASRLAHLDPTIVRGRAALMTHIIVSACADAEEQAERDETTPRWHETGDFLSDAITGMLLAPVSRRATTTDSPGRDSAVTP